MKALTLQGVTKEYGGRPVLHIPELEIGDGEVCALLGPNGAGKTTLLTILAHLERPDGGHVRYRGAPPALLERERQRLRRELQLLERVAGELAELSPTSRRP